MPLGSLHSPGMKSPFGGSKNSVLAGLSYAYIPTTIYSKIAVQLQARGRHHKSPDRGVERVIYDPTYHRRQFATVWLSERLREQNHPKPFFFKQRSSICCANALPTARAVGIHSARGIIPAELLP